MASFSPLFHQLHLSNFYILDYFTQWILKIAFICLSTHSSSFPYSIQFYTQLYSELFPVKNIYAKICQIIIWLNNDFWKWVCECVFGWVLMITSSTKLQLQLHLIQLTVKNHKNLFLFLFLHLTTTEINSTNKNLYIWVNDYVMLQLRDKYL